MDQDRLVDLEVKYAHLELAVERLEQITRDQDASIRELTRLLKLVRERVDAVARGDHQVGPNEKPPHY